MVAIESVSDFKSLSLRDVLAARDQYHWQLANCPNVVGTAVGLYLIRTGDPWPGKETPSVARRPGNKTHRTLENSEVRPYSWPCVLVFVDAWHKEREFVGGHLHPQDMVPRTLYLSDGRMVPVCVVLVEPAAAAVDRTRSTVWPATPGGGGFPLVVTAQHLRRAASVGCLVTDGHTVYVLTNRHVCGEPGERISAITRRGELEIGTASRRQITREEFRKVYPSFGGNRTYLNMDVGLVAVDDANDWSSSFYGLGEVGDVVDLNEASIGLQLIEKPVVAYGAASGPLEGTVKALFFRYKSVGGFDYVADVLIAPTGRTSTQPGDSGTVWHVRLPDDTPGPLGPDAPAGTSTLHPLAVEWGAQTLDMGGSRWSFALATNLSNVCRLLDVDVMLAHNLGPRPFWGSTGHYTIASTAVAQMGSASKLGRLLQANADTLSLPRSDLDKGGIDEGKLKTAPLVPLADVPDLVWKQTPWTVRGGRDTSRNVGPEHPNHFCDIDRRGPGGRTLRARCVQDPDQVAVDVWQAYYLANGHTLPAERGCLPFRVWQIYDAMVACTTVDDYAGFVTAAGVLAHYVGDACQPLHGSYLADGYEDQKEAYTTSGGKTAYRWPGQGVHSAFESVMIDRYAGELFDRIDAQMAAEVVVPPSPRSGHAAAVAVVELMDRTATHIRPRRLINRYIALGGGTSRATIDGLWSTFGTATATVMADGVVVLGAIWEGAWVKGGGPGAAIADLGLVDPKVVAARYRDTGFVPSLDLDHIGSVLT